VNLVATKQKTSAISSKTPSNMMAVSVVVGLVLFGLGYVVGKTKATLRAESMYTARMNTMRQELMKDEEYRQSFMEQMMTDDVTRDDVLKRVDDYRTNLKRQMMYRK
jgi:hypothetical protein